MFAIITRSAYVIFTEIEGFTKNPITNKPNMELDEENILEENENNINNENDVIAVSGKIIKMFVASTIVLEDQIVECLQLEKLNVLKLKNNRTNEILGEANTLTFTSKSSAIASNVLSYWKAGFINNKEVENKNFKDEYYLNFITPEYITKKEIEKHLLKITIKPTTYSPTYTYRRKSLKRIKGRKYKN